ncbi:hypothetical protein AB0E62_00455 [Streptomyces sp. NPDC038707]|uniref:hypothetical protein n=1 Tax=Streptomyces sp. NPDC038707 TaxID=3154329 RepID=UPI0033EB1218
MKIWIITQGHDSTYVSAWRTREAAQRETDRLNAEYLAKYGRRPFDWEEDELND